MTSVKLNELKTNLLHVPQSYAIAVDISTDLDAGLKGSIPWQVSLVFGPIDELSKCQQQLLLGSTAVLENNGRFIYFLLAKDHVNDHCTIDTLQASLICMREHMRNHGVTKVAMPPIAVPGYSLQKIKQLMQVIFANEYNVEIMLCEQEPQMPFIPKCEIIEVKGNVFSAPEDYSLVHSVAADFAMCSGINLQFKCKYGQVNELIKQHKHSGNVAVLKDKNRYIYNLVTKERHHEKCTYAALYYALTAMREHMLENNIRKLAIPRFGCGIDRLNWERVKSILQLVFLRSPIEIIAYLYVPTSTTSLNSTNVHCQTCGRVY